jgi:hypothetical protein
MLNGEAAPPRLLVICPRIVAGSASGVIAPVARFMRFDKVELLLNVSSTPARSYAVCCLGTHRAYSETDETDFVFFRRKNDSECIHRCNVELRNSLDRRGTTSRDHAGRQH